MIKEHKQCRLCSSSDIEPIVNIGATALANSYRTSKDQSFNEYPLVLMLCRECSSIQLQHTVDPTLLFSNYLYKTSDNPALVKYFADYAQSEFSRFDFSVNDFIVDIGGNCGELSRQFKKLGYRVLNVEPAQNLAQYSAQTVDTVNAFFSPETAQKIKDEYGPADVITSNNCFAHTADLHYFLSGIIKLLSDDGLFIFENAYWLDSFKGNYIDQIYHEHIFYHSIKPLKRLLKQYGLNIIDIKKTISQGGSIRVYCSKKANEASLVNEMIKAEDAAKIYHPSVYQSWMTKFRRIDFNLNLILQTYHEIGLQIAAYGAPAKLTTLYKVLKSLKYINYCVDDSPLKVGKYLPGENVKIESVEFWKKKNPPYTLISAWNFARNIIEKHSDYNLNGDFILPLPHIQLI